MRPFIRLILCATLLAGSAVLTGTLTAASANNPHQAGEAASPGNVQAYQAVKCGISGTTWYVRKDTTDTIDPTHIVYVMVNKQFLCAVVDRGTVYSVPLSSTFPVADSEVTNCESCSDLL